MMLLQNTAFLFMFLIILGDITDCTESRPIEGFGLQRSVGYGGENIVVYAAEDSILSGSRLATNNDGYTGEAFIDFGGIGSSASWTIDVPVSGLYNITLRYASRGERGPLDLLLDNLKLGSFDIKKVANNWNAWKDETIQVNLNAGGNRTLKLFASVVQGPNVDKITLQFVDDLQPTPSNAPKPEVPKYKTILLEEECLGTEDYRESEAGVFQIGLQESGDLVVLNKASSNVVWSLSVWEGNRDAKLCLQNNGRLVVVEATQELPICINDDVMGIIFERDISFKLGINDFGGIAVFLDPENLFWIGGPSNEYPTELPTSVPTRSPTEKPTAQMPFTVPTQNPITIAPVPSPEIPPMNTPTPSRPPYSNEDLKYKATLLQNDYFGQKEQNFGRSLSGEYEVGLNTDGNLVVRETQGNKEEVWVLRDESNGKKVFGSRLYMQNDGNLVMRREDRKAVWTSQTADPKGRTGFSFGINNCGSVAVYRTSSPTSLVWIGGIQGICLISTPVVEPSTSPILVPNAVPMPAPLLPSPTPPTIGIAYSVILASNGRLVERNRFLPSPNGEYEVGLNSQGQFIMRRGLDKNLLWVLRDKKGIALENISKIFMQSDGNLVMKTSQNGSVWNSETSKNPGGEFHINDGGQVSINYQGTALWIDGLPRAVYTTPPSPDMELRFPIRGFFYYAWYPETWSVGGKPIKYRPNLGSIGEREYRSGDPIVVHNHIKALDYAWADLCIVSWWGPSDRLDRARITQLLDETVAQASSLKWTVYYEDEKQFDKSVDELVADLNYLKEWFAWHPSWAHVDSKPVIFIWNESDCEVADRWTEAARKANWYVVLKLFGKYNDCKSQPDSWHQYGVASSYLDYPPYSFTIGPGFFRADTDKPDVPRTSQETFCNWVDEMNKSERDWQLVVSFNEWGEGTAVESAVEWQSDSGFGQYLDCLHNPNAFA